MSTRVTIVVLGKYNDVFSPFAESVVKYCPQVPVVFVRDGHDISPMPKWALIQGPERFSMAGNGNLGLMAADAASDILYCGDDIRFCQPRTVETLFQIAHSDDRLGILSPKICGRGSATQLAPTSTVTICSPIDMWFPCVFIKRRLIDAIGYLDERFDGFGSDDLDYCTRCLLAGFTLAVTSAVTVQHNGSPEDGPTTFARSIGEEEWERQRTVSLNKIRVKYDLNQNDFQRFLISGDVKYLYQGKLRHRLDDGSASNPNAG